MSAASLTQSIGMTSARPEFSVKTMRGVGGSVCSPWQASAFKILAPARLGKRFDLVNNGGIMPDETNDGTAATVLVVEDDFDLRDALVPILEYEGHRVVSAANGQEALDRLHTMPPPSLILLDLMMPVMNGEEFRAEQLRDPTLASIPVVVVSAHPGAEERARRIGAAGCVKKPFEIEDLLEQVRRSSRRPVAAVPTPGPTATRLRRP